MVNAPYLSHLKYNRQLERAQSHDLSRLSSEVSSGGESEGFESVPNLKELISQEVILEGVKSYRKDTLTNRQKMVSIGIVMTDLRGITTDLQTRVMGFTSNPANNMGDLQDYCRGQLQWMTTLLNKQYAGEYLFGGIASTIPAVTDLNTLSIPSIGDPVDTNYYLGSNVNQSFRADDNTDVSTPVRADNIGIANLIMALRYCLAFPADELHQRLATANDLCLEAQKGIIDASAYLDSQMNIIDTTEHNLGELEQRLEENIQAIGVRSQADAIQDFYQKKTTLAITQFVTMNSLTAVRDLVDRMPR